MLSIAVYSPSYPELQSAYHFALLCRGTSESARALVMESIVHLGRRLHDYRDHNRIRRLWYSHLLQSGFSNDDFQVSAPPTSFQQALDGLSGGDRALLAAHLFLPLESEETAKAVNLDQSEYRERLAALTQQPAEPSDADDASPTPRGELLRNEVAALPLPDDLPSAVTTALEKSGHGTLGLSFMVRHPAMIAVAASVLILLVWGGIVLRDEMQRIPGGDLASEMLLQARNLEKPPLDPVESPAEILSDWFFLNHGLEHYNVPPEFADRTTTACRVFLMDGYPVAQINFADDDLVLLLFKTEHFGLQLPYEETWQIFTVNNDAVALQNRQGLSALAAMEGSPQDLENRLTEE